jgi:hypothetical protein
VSSRLTANGSKIDTPKGEDSSFQFVDFDPHLASPMTSEMKVIEDLRNNAASVYGAVQFQKGSQGDSTCTLKSTSNRASGFESNLLQSTPKH